MGTARQTCTTPGGALSIRPENLSIRPEPAPNFSLGFSLVPVLNSIPNLIILVVRFLAFAQEENRCYGLALFSDCID